jgi:hypothetical protein
MLKQISFLLAIAMLAPHIAVARIQDLRSSGPLSTRSQNPLYLQFLGMPIESAQTLNKHQMESSAETTFSNVFEKRVSGTTQVSFDMEIWRTALTYKYGATDNLDFKIELPFLTTGGGFLDSFIQGYHDAFGFPNGGRNRFPNGTFDFQLTQGGTTVFNYADTDFGLSDITLRAKYLIPKLPFKLPIKIALATYLKLPTGKLTEGASSGYPDLGETLLIETRLKRFHFVTQAGVAILTGHDKMASLLRNFYFQFGQSVEFQILDGLSAIAQVTGNTSAFKNVTAQELKSPVVDLNLGVAGTFPLHHKIFDEFYYQFSFGEDVTAIGPSVDFSVLWLVGVRY